MGYQIIRQPNDHYALYSSITDTIVMWDATEDEVVEWFADAAAKDARRTALRLISFVASGHPNRAYHQFTLSWPTVLQRDRDNGGEAWQAFTDPGATP